MEDARIELLKEALKESRVIPKAEKDALADDLEYAQTINGDPDPTRQMMKRSLISGVRREMLAHERHAQATRDFAVTLQKALKEHMENCAKIGGRKTEDGGRKTEDGGRKERTFLSFKVGNKTVYAGGWAAAILALTLAFGALKMMQNGVAKAAAEAATREMVKAYLEQK